MFNFQQEIEDQLREIKEQYGDQVLKEVLQELLDQDYYDGEYCNPPVYRWSRPADSAECARYQTV